MTETDVSQADVYRLRDHVQRLESELEEMTAALAATNDVLVPLLQASIGNIVSEDDIVRFLKTISSAVNASFSALYLAPQGENEALWQAFPADVLDFHNVEPVLVEILRQNRAQYDARVPMHSGITARWMFAPIRVGQSTVGAIGVGIVLTEREFRASDASAITRITERVADQLIRVMLQQSMAREAHMAEQIRIAGEIQRSIQPISAPDVPGLELASYWEPAYEVGGDAWGWTVRPDGRLGIFLVDVAGKGLPAAMAAFGLHTLLRGGMGLALDATSLLQTLNRTFYESFTRTEMIATACVVIIDFRTGDVEVASAGHTPLVVRLQGEWKQFPASAPPVGALQHIEPVAHQFAMLAGDSLLLYSDGITETVTDQGWWGTDNMISVTDNVLSPAQTMMDRIVTAAHLARVGPVSDDQTLICVVFGQHEHLSLPARFDVLGEVGPFAEKLLPEDDWLEVSQVHLALHELCTNIIQHAYAFESGQIDIDATRDASSLLIEIRDWASNRYDDSVILHRPVSSDLQIGGWGMSIIHKVMDRVEYSRLPDGNMWRLFRRLQSTSSRKQESRS
jgi:serine phosphatase RsbU (regulator of sigma subunit)/anti-sigma regulatory factor (Ser/Thr protein kinase)